MGRLLKIEYKGVIDHVTSPGNRREEIYLYEADRTAWLAVVATVAYMAVTGAIKKHG